MTAASRVTLICLLSAVVATAPARTQAQENKRTPAAGDRAPERPKPNTTGVPTRVVTPPQPSPAPAQEQQGQGQGQGQGQKGRKPAEPVVTSPSGPDDLPPDDGSELYRCKRLPSSAKIKVTFKPETDLKELVSWAMGFTCRNFIYGTGISARAAKVTIVAPSEMTPVEAWRLFLVALQTMNLTVVPKGDVLEIIEAPRAREAPVPVYRTGGAAPATDQVVRAIIRPEHIAVDDLAAILNALKSKDGIVTPLPNAGVVIVTDYGSTIDRMMDVVRQVDQPAEGDRIYIIRIHNADATEIAQKLNEIFGVGQGAQRGGAAPPRPAPAPDRRGGAAAPQPAVPAGAGGADGDGSAGSATPTKIIPDERTNSLIVIASERAYTRVLALVRRLDVALEGGEGRIHVYYLNNADAEELAGTLNTLISGSGAPRPAGRGGAQQQQPQPAGGAAGGGQAFEGQVRITFDKPTNSLVIVSSVKDFISVREVIRKLDVPRRQVFVEATILEVSLDKTRRLGLSFHGGLPVSVGGEDSLVFGGVQHSGLGSVPGLTFSTDQVFGLFGGALGSEIPNSESFLGVSVPSFGVMFQLLQNNNDVNVLSAPHLLTTDNVPAEITVGQNIPFQSGVTGIPGAGQGGQNQVPGGFGFPFQSIQRQDVGLKLKITPHVNESDFVRLEIEQEINDIASENFAGLGPSWTKRTIKTTVVVRDQQPVVIGGLMSDVVRINQSKVPLLGDIPILGYLFKFERKTKQKTNLLIFLTPYIIKEQADIRRIFDKKIRERREFIQTFTSFQEREFHPDVDYRRKRGLVEEINQRVRQAEEDARLDEEAASAAQQYHFDGLVEDVPPPATAPSGGQDQP